MLLDHTIPKPKSLEGYRVHQLVQGITNGETPLFLDKGYSILVRTEQSITEKGEPIRSVSEGDIIAFELRACVSKKVSGKHKYFEGSNYKARHDWLRAKGAQNGFEPLTMTCSTEMQKIMDAKGRSFLVDKTDFAGILKVVDVENFNKALKGGIGSTAKAFGFGLLVI